MRKILASLVVFFIAQISYSQFVYTGTGSNIYYNAGNVAIGFAGNATQALEVNGNIRFGQNSVGGSYALEWFTSSYGSGYGHKFYNVDMGGGRIDLRLASRTGSTTWNDAVTFINNGSVGIGTTDPRSFKLAVEGKIGAREVNVTTQNPWPDYVFHKKYSLLPLKELESFIKIHNRLPNIPSAEEVKLNGIDLGQMNSKLLEKVEELTLHLIQLNKKIEELEAKYSEFEIKKSAGKIK